MNEIVDRLHEKRSINRAKEILESNGYEVVKESVPPRPKKSVKESKEGKPIKEKSCENISARKKVDEDQVQLNPKNSEEAMSKVEVKPLKSLRPFSKEDYYGWDATPLSSGDPYIWGDDDYTMLVVSTADRKEDVTPDTPAEVEIYFSTNPDEDELSSSYFMQGAEKDILSKADEIASKLEQGQDLKKLARQYGMKYREY